MANVTKMVELSPQDATSIMEALLTEGASLRDAEKRSDTERLAIGVVCLSKNLQGKSQRVISEELNIPQPTVHRYMQRALQTLALPTVTEARLHAIEKIDRQLDIWEPKAENDLGAAGLVAKLLAERAKLTGAYAPIEINQHVSEETAAERELRMMMEETDRENKAKESSLVERSK